MQTQDVNAVRIHKRSIFFSQPCLSLLLLVVTTLLLATSVHATNTWLGATGNWSDSTKWASGLVPSTDGTADIYITTPATNFTSIVDTNWAIYGAVNSITIGSEGAGTCTLNTKPTGGSGLKLGAGGLTQNSTASLKLSGLVNPTASQPWNMTSTGGGIYNYGQTLALTSQAGVVITKTGSAGLTLDTGSSAGFMGSFVLADGSIGLVSPANFYRLTTNAMPIGDATITGLTFINFGSSGAFPTPQVFGNKAAPHNITISQSNYSINGGNLTLSGGLFGNLTGGSSMQNNGVMTGGGIRLDTFDFYDRRFQYTLSAAGTLSSDGNAANGNVGVAIVAGTLVLDNNDALGPNNRTSVGLGHWNSSTIGLISGLLATSGHHVSAPIRLFNTRTTSNNRWNGAVGELGLLTTNAGLIEFSGNIYMEGTNAVERVPSLRLRVPAGGTARFSGTIQDATTTTYYSPVVIHGGTRDYAAGIVEFTGSNTYQGATAIRSGTLLLSNTNALGSGSVSLGDAVVPIASVRVNYERDYLSSETPDLGLLTVDGVTLSDGDRVLVYTVGNTKYNGIWVAHALGTPWTRATDFNEVSDLVPGLQVAVTAGITNINKRFFLPYFSTNKFAFASNGVRFHEDAVNPDVALLLSGSYTVTNTITVTANNSTGLSVLGSTGTVVAGFSGPVTLNRNVVVTTSTGGSTTFSGDIAGAGGVTAANGGLLKFTGNKTYIGATVITNGSVQVNSTLASTSVTFSANTTFVVDLTSTNTYDHLTLTNGSVALNGAHLTVNMVGNYAPVYPAQFRIVQADAPGSITGTFACGGMVTSSNGKSTFTVSYDGNSVILAPAAAGSIIIIQ